MWTQRPHYVEKRLAPASAPALQLFPSTEFWAEGEDLSKQEGMVPALDLADRLQQELVQRCQKNPKYSLRAFAKGMGVDPSLLSKVIHRKRRLSSRSLQKIARHLSFSPDEYMRYQTEDELEVTPAPNQALRMAADQFALIADWYHYAVFELVEVVGFDPSPRWIAQSLGISVAEARGAVERLLRLGILNQQPNGDLVKAQRFITTTGNPFTTSAFRQLQKGILEKACEALENVPFEERDQSSMTVAIAEQDLPRAQDSFRRLRQEIGQLGETTETKERVYHLSISFYPVSQRTRR